MLPLSPYSLERRCSRPSLPREPGNHSSFPGSGLGSPWVQTARPARARTGPGGESCLEHPSCQSSFIHSFIHSWDVGSPGGTPAQSPPPSWGRLGWHRACSQGTASLRRWLLQERGGRAGWQGGRALHGRPTKITPQIPSPPPP